MPAREPDRHRGVGRLSDPGGQTDDGGTLETLVWMTEFTPPLIRYAFSPVCTPFTGTLLGSRHVSTASIHDLDVEQARQLVDAHQTEDLNLDGLTSLTPEVATVLADNETVLSLNGLSTITEAVVHALSAHKGIGMWLNGLTTLSPQAAAALVHPRAFRCLDGIQELVPDAADTAFHSTA
jgi:hypothetical protein